MSQQTPPPGDRARIDVNVERRAGAPSKVVVSTTDGDISLRVPLRSYEATGLAGDLVRAAYEAGPQSSDAALTAVEFGEMAKLIRRFAVSEMDQWEMFSVTTDSGPIYVGITMEVSDPSAFHNIDGFIAGLDDAEPTS